MKLPAIDLSELVKLLEKEGGTELRVAAGPKFGETIKGVSANSKLIKEWDNIILILEKEIIPLLSKGCEMEHLVAPAKKLAKSAGTLSLIAADVLSFVPGPIGIVCSLALAISCFSVGNIPGGFFELLGCIPGGKVAGKASSKLFPKVEKILIDFAKSNPSFKFFFNEGSKQSKKVLEFFEKHAPKNKVPKADVGKGYGVRAPNESISNGTLNPAIEAQREIGKYTTLSYPYGTLPKTNLWPHLY